MEIRNTLPEDMDRVMFIFEQAKQFMRLNGNLHQWTGGYPSEEVLEADISSNKKWWALSAFVTGFLPSRRIT